ncbi:rhomboid-related protein 4 isoform X1 [Pseudophryne corroboree]|uniref:rhomboid-related protein 4 isoform X1 n=1 Tax=Pseudophryne corroboree TaxID=495146 RepID=UPI003081C4CD
MFRGRRGGNVGLMLLFFQILNFGLNNIPPVTLAVLGLNIYLFFNPYKPLQYACISVHESYYHDDWQRLLLSPFHHADDWHLYFNMMSLLWKGTKLEQRLGSILFAIIVFVFSQLTGAVYLMVQLFLARYMDDPLYTLQCAVGFSGVLFALKVLNNHYHPGGAYNFFGFLIPNKYSCWAELVAIHFLAPGTSFVGHLSGILVGLLFVHGPLGQILTAAAPLFNSGRAARRGNVRYDGVSLDQDIDFITGLLDMYRSHECLWKVKAKGYSDKVRRNAALEELVDYSRPFVSGADKDWVKKKIQNLRTVFLKEHKKNGIVKKVWSWFLPGLQDLALVLHLTGVCPRPGAYPTRFHLPSSDCHTRA